jgi:hypothetical protein
MAAELMENQRKTLSQLAGYVRVLNVITAIVQLTAGIATLVQLHAFTISKILIASYVIVFALLLLCFEGSFSETDPFLRQNFGFLYSYQGLGLYLFFIGLMDLCLSGGFFGIVAGIVAVVTAIIILLSGFFMRKSFSPDSTSPIAATIHEAVDKLPSYGSIKKAAEKGGAKAKDAAADALEKGKQAAGEAKDKTSQVGEKLAEKTRSAKKAISDKMSS